MKLFISIILFLTIHLSSPAQINPTGSTSKDERKTSQEKNTYLDFRQLAFSVKPSDLELSLPVDQTIVFGVIMDWDIGKTIATIVAFQTGDASVYLKSGQMFIGGSSQKKIKDAAIDLVNNAQSFLDKVEVAMDNSSPDKACIKFYLLTNTGTFVHQETVQSIRDHKNEWANLFNKGNLIITEYRLTTSNK